MWCAREVQSVRWSVGCNISIFHCIHQEAFSDAQLRVDTQTPMQLLRHRMKHPYPSHMPADWEIVVVATVRLSIRLPRSMHVLWGGGREKQRHKSSCCLRSLPHVQSRFSASLVMKGGVGWTPHAHCGRHYNTSTISERLTSSVGRWMSLQQTVLFASVCEHDEQLVLPESCTLSTCSSLSLEQILH